MTYILGSSFLIYDMNEILSFIIAGFEKSGTTLVSEIFRQHPGVDSGFETGFLLHPTPAAYFRAEKNPWFRSKSEGNHMLATGWGLDQAGVDAIRQSKDWKEAYLKLRQHASLIEDKNVLLFDKTPKYMLHLSEVLERANVPVICTWKDPRGLLASFRRHVPMNVNTFVKRYRNYATAALKERNNPLVLNVRYETLCQCPKEICRQMFEHVGLEFDERYLTFEPKYHNARGTSITTEHVGEHKGVTPDECGIIMENLKDICPVMSG
jgi:hypothetical protein